MSLTWDCKRELPGELPLRLQLRLCLHPQLLRRLSFLLRDFEFPVGFTLIDSVAEQCKCRGISQVSVSGSFAQFAQFAQLFGCSIVSSSELALTPRHRLNCCTDLPAHDLR